MARVVTTAQQGYEKHEGNLLDAATSAMALYNLPQNMRLQMDRAKLQNQGLQLGNQNQSMLNTGLQHNLNAPAILSGAQDEDTPPTAPRKMFTPGSQTSAMPPDNGLTSPPPGYGPASIGDSSGNMFANTNENSSHGGVSNDLTLRGTSAEELGQMGIDPYNTSKTASMLSHAQEKATRSGLPNNAPAMANGTSARPNSELPPTIPGSTQGGGPIDSPFNFRPFSSKGLTFNSGEAGDNSGSMPREDSNNFAAAPVVSNPNDHAKLASGTIYQDAQGNYRRKAA